MITAGLLSASRPRGATNPTDAADPAGAVDPTDPPDAVAPADPTGAADPADALPQPQPPTLGGHSSALALPGAGAGPLGEVPYAGAEHPPPTGPTEAGPHATAALLEARDRLARRVLARVGADGLLAAPCESRVLESALLLHLVVGLTPSDPARDRLTRYLKHALDTDPPGSPWPNSASNNTSQRASAPSDPTQVDRTRSAPAPPDPIQRAVARAVLGEVVPGDAETERALSRFAHFTAGRKRRMFQTLLAHLGAAPWPDVPLEAYEARGQQSWLALEMAALKVLAAHGTGRTAALTSHDWAALAPALRTGPVWEANHLARLLGLLALGTDPVRRTEVAAAVTRLARELRPDGGLPFITGMDVFATATGGLALTAAGYGAHPAVARMGLALAARQHEDGGFGFMRGVRQSDADDTAYAVEFLRATDPTRHAAVIDAAEDYLMGLANDDGGIPTFARGIDSEPAMTAGAVNALAPSPRCRPTVEAAARFLTGEAGAAALHERSWSRNVTNAAHRTLLACDSLASLASSATLTTRTAPTSLTAAPAPRPVPRERLDAFRARLLTHLLERRLPDGGWGHEDTGPSDPISTAYATIALARAPGHAAELRAAVDYLAARQRPDGGFDSVPDQAGPRPLLYDAPALADNCVLLAWGHALGRSAPAPVPASAPAPTHP